MTWSAIADRDRQLREAVDSASEELARHRYANTIAAGVSFAEYARQCGVSEVQVRNYAKAGDLIIRGNPSDISTALVRASTSTDRADVIEEVAEAEGITPGSAQTARRSEVRRIESIARERAAERGTTVREEARTLAQTSARHRAADAQDRESRRHATDLRYLEVERHLGSARRALMAAAAVDAQLDDEHRELLGEALRVVRQLVELIDMRFVGAAEIDWDTELMRITREHL